VAKTASLLATCVAIAFGAAACGDDDEDTAGGADTIAETAPAEPAGGETEAGGDGGAAAPRAAKVEIVDFAFKPPTTTIQAGGKVTWLNQDAAAHTASAEDGAFDTGTLDEGKLQAETFEQPGTYSYICEFHPYMEATVEVVE
jgi:plastocyanin